MKRLWCGARRTLASCVRQLLRSLSVVGAINVGLTGHHFTLFAPESAPHSQRQSAWYAPRRPQLSSGSDGPPPAHPERLCEDVPLSDQERLIARELWPAYNPEWWVAGGS